MRVSSDDTKEFVNELPTTTRLSRAMSFLILCVVFIGLGVALSGAANMDSDLPDQKSLNASSTLPSKERLEAKSRPDQEPLSTFAVSIRQPSGPPQVATGQKDADGNAVTVACSTCHTTRPPNFQNKTPKDLDEFHAEMPFSHGNVSCLSCHNENDYDALKLADGSRVDFTEVMSLCAQCHGPQMTAYEHGAHGGMTGHWDLSKGPRLRNNCVDCHNPHSPQFPKMRPTFKPQDRFLSPGH